MKIARFVLKIVGASLTLAGGVCLVIGFKLLSGLMDGSGAQEAAYDIITVRCGIFHLSSSPFYAFIPYGDSIHFPAAPVKYRIYGTVHSLKL